MISICQVCFIISELAIDPAPAVNGKRERGLEVVMAQAFMQEILLRTVWRCMSRPERCDL